MRIPDKIKIGAHVYRVVFPYVFRECPEYAGQADHELLEIRLRAIEVSGGERADSRILSTLVHEILHCIDWNTGRDLFPEEDREAKIDRLAEGLTAVLVDNNLIETIIENRSDTK